MTSASEEQAEPPGEVLRVLAWVVRIGIPLILTGAGVALIVMGHGRYTSVFASRDSFLSAAGVAFIVIAMMVALMGWLIRLGGESDDERVEEERAREYLRRTGHWPNSD